MLPTHRYLHLSLGLCVLGGIHSFSELSQLQALDRLRSPCVARLFASTPVPEEYGNSNRRIVVVGKIIIDQYGDPSTRVEDEAPSLTVGGGGPQACWGAAAALACRDISFRDSKSQPCATPVPPKQPITFIAPIGTQNWSKKHATEFHNIRPTLDVSPVLIESDNHITPTINIWHDENEIQKWHPVDGSFDAIGADGLWRNRPSAHDILSAVPDENDGIVLHCILESGSNPAGQGEDSLFLDCPELMNRIAVLGIEPIVFPDESTLKVSAEDGQSVNSLILRAKKSLVKDDQLLIVTPDRACFESSLSTDGGDLDTTNEIVVRDGANGS